MDILPVALMTAFLPGVIGAVAGGSGWVTILSVILLATAFLLVSSARSVCLLQWWSAGLFGVMAARDVAVPYPAARTGS